MPETDTTEADGEQEKRRFGRIRDVGEGVVDAAKTVTGQSTAEQIAEFTNAYTEVVTGLDGDVRSLERRVAALEQAEQDNRATARVAGIRGAVLTVVSLVVAIVAIILAVA